MTTSSRLTHGLGALLWLLACICGGPAQAQAVAPETTDPPRPRVLELQGELEADKILVVRVEGLAEWATAPGHSPWRLVPYINGLPLQGLYPLAVNLHAATVQFHLRITPQNQATWIRVLSPLTLNHPVDFSIGPEEQDPFDTVFTRPGHPALLTVVNPRWLALAAGVLLVFAFSFCALATRTDLLMERTTSTQGADALSFSLAKVQLALWFFVIFGSFLAIWLVTGNFNTIDSSLVATLGISAGTAVGDAYIKSANPPETPPAGPAVRPDWAAKRFVRELISDSEGYSIYRFQMLAWTAALIVVFLADVSDDLAMPSFSPELLYLLGLSTGTYVANRMPEMAQTRARSRAAAAAVTTPDAHPGQGHPVQPGAGPLTPA